MLNVGAPSNVAFMMVKYELRTFPLPANTIGRGSSQLSEGVLKMSAVKSACALQHRSALSSSAVSHNSPFCFSEVRRREAKSAMARATARGKASAKPIAVNRRISHINLFAPPQQESQREQPTEPTCFWD